MSNALFPYDIQLYNRNFLNCAQRQSVVMLKRAGLAVDWLFYTAQVSTDLIRDFSLIEQKPKYDFEYDGLSDVDFNVIGVDRQNHFVDSFDDAKLQLLEVIKRDGFVLSSCNLFFVPHRPEYFRKKEVVHFQTLTGYNPADKTWSVVDDNSAGILAHFIFKENILREFYDTGLIKGYRSFAVSQRDPATVRMEIEALFNRHREDRNDSLALLRDIEAYIVAEPVRLKMLGEAFSLLSGSRHCFAQYLRLADAASVWIDLADKVGRDAAKVRDVFTMAQVGGKMNIANIRQKALAIADMEARLGKLRSVREVH